MSDMLAIGASGLRAYQVALNHRVGEYRERRHRRLYAAHDQHQGSRRDRRHQRAVDRQRRWASRSSASRAPATCSAGRSALVGRRPRARPRPASTWLDRIETSLSGSQLGTRLSSFFTSATTLAGDPTSTARARGDARSGERRRQRVQRNRRGARPRRRPISTPRRATPCRSLNSLAATLAKINDGLGRAAPGTAGSAALLDQRDQTARAMSALTDVNVSYDNAGRATVNVGGSGGPLLVDGNYAATVGYSRNASGAVAFARADRRHRRTRMSPTGGALAGHRRRRAAHRRRAPAARHGIAAEFRRRRQRRPGAAAATSTAIAGAAMFAIDPSAAPRQISVTLDRPARHRRGGGRRRPARQQQSRRRSRRCAPPARSKAAWST